MIVKKCRYIGIFLILSNMVIHAQSYTGPTPSKIPQLGNHQFITNPFVRDPFIQTHIRNTLGIGQAFDMMLPVLTINDQVVFGLRGDLMFVKLEFEYQYAFKKWMAPFVKFMVYGRLGTGVQSLLAQGISSAVSMEFGWMFKLYQSERSQLSATVNLWNSSGAIVNFYDYINNIIEEGEVTPENQLVRAQPYLRGGGGLRYALAVSDLVGINLLTELGYGESVDRRIENKLYYKIGGSADLDMADTKIKIPVGFSFGFVYDTFLSGTDNTIDGDLENLFLRIAYTGRTDFLVGLDLAWSRLPLKEPDQDLRSTILTINMTYFF